MPERQTKGAIEPAPLIAAAAAFVVLAAMLRTLMAPVFADPSLYARFDWDAALAHRYAVVVALRRYHELPFYSPWVCGGFPAWAFSEGAENLVSPFLPLYLFAPLHWAFRLEVLGSAVLSLAFSYLAASRVTKSVAVRLAVVAASALNGRWAFQIGAGHLWHLQYAWMPLAFYFFDRAIREGQRRHVVFTAMTLALMVYMGALYPLPHTLLFLGAYAAFASFELSSPRPLAILAAAGALSVGLAAPKLFPMLDLMKRFPRFTESPEAIHLPQAIAMLTARDQHTNFFPVPVPYYGWHEWGIYVGWAGVAFLLVALVFGRTKRELGFAFIGLTFFVLGHGALSPWAPWTLLHALPPFSSQHVPSRFFFPAIFALALGAGSIAGRWLDGRVLRSRWLDLALLLPVGWMALDISKEARHGVENIFVLTAPSVPEGQSFAQTAVPKYDYSEPEWTGATLLMMKQNLGRMQSCYGLPKDGEGLQRGAIAREWPDYRGESYIAYGPGEAKVVKWSPSSADVEYHGASNGALVVYNMNWDPGWRADGAEAVNYENAVAAPVSVGDGVVHYAFYPPGLNAGLFAFAATIVGLGVGAARRRG